MKIKLDEKLLFQEIINNLTKVRTEEEEKLIISYLEQNPKIDYTHFASHGYFSGGGGSPLFINKNFNGDPKIIILDACHVTKESTYYQNEAQPAKNIKNESNYPEYEELCTAARNILPKEYIGELLALIKRWEKQKLPEKQILERTRNCINDMQVGLKKCKRDDWIDRFLKQIGKYLPSV